MPWLICYYSQLEFQISSLFSQQSRSFQWNSMWPRSRLFQSVARKLGLWAHCNWSRAEQGWTQWFQATRREWRWDRLSLVGRWTGGWPLSGSRRWSKGGRRKHSHPTGRKTSTTSDSPVGEKQSVWFQYHNAYKGSWWKLLSNSYSNFIHW